jgi:hypothetical protein
MPPVKQGYMSYLVMQQLGTFPQRKTSIIHSVNRTQRLRSSGALKRGVSEVVERLTAGFTAVTFPLDLTRTSFNNVLQPLSK